MDKNKLINWLNRVFFTPDDSRGPCVRLTCHHVGDKGAECFHVMVPNKNGVVTADDDEIAMLANDIEGSALEDAEGIGGVQRYKLVAHYLKSNNTTRFTFRMHGSEMDEDSDGLSEPATAKGHMGQMMRHNEALMRIAVLGANQTIGMQNRMLARQADQIERLLQGRQETFTLLEELQSRKHERELMTQQAANQEERYQQLFQKANILLPIVANKVAGRKVLPEHQSPTETMLKSFAESLSPAQMSAIMPHLAAEQKIALIEFIQQVQDEEGASDDGPEEKKKASG